MTGHPHPDPEPGAGLKAMHALYQTPIKWQVVSVQSDGIERAWRSPCRVYTIAFIGTPPSPTYYEASASGEGVIARNTKRNPIKAACERHRDNRMGLIKEAA